MLCHTSCRSLLCREYSVNAEQMPLVAQTTKNSRSAAGRQTNRSAQ